MDRGQRRQLGSACGRYGSVAGGLAALGLVLAAGPGATQGAERAPSQEPAAGPVVAGHAPDDVTPPASASAPRVVGLPRAGEVLAATEGTWSGTPPIRFAYRWERCDSGEGCAPVGGARSRGYVVSASDVGAAIRVAVSASNAAGRSSPAYSQPTRAVESGPLLNVGPPAIIGPPEVGRAVRATAGRWTSGGAMEFVYSWVRCRADGSGCTPIPGTVDATYRLRAPDARTRLRVRVTAIGDAGVATAESAPSAIVRPERPALIRPFPIVHIKGVFTATGATLGLVSVTAPTGARITVTCSGEDCPFGRIVRRGRGSVRVRALERQLRAGTRFAVRVTKAGLIGKYTRIVIRADRPPARRDRCLRPDRVRPVRCPER